MATLKALSPDAHRTLKLKSDNGISYAKKAHMLSLRVTEVAQATVDFPVFISRMGNGSMSLSALTSFEPGKNLFVSKGEWISSFTPTAMKTYPIFLMKPKKGNSEPVMGIDEGSEALSTTEGQAIFDSKGKLSLPLKQLKTQLMEDSRNIVHTAQFFETLTSYGLVVPIDMSLNYSDGKTNRVRGLSMIHEDKFQSLSAENLADLRDRGYLAPIYAMLFSVFQLNALIRRNNQVDDIGHIKSINLEVSKDTRLA